MDAGQEPGPTWYLYLIECRNGRLYAGIATDPRRRFADHAAGRGDSARVREVEASFVSGFGRERFEAAVERIREYSWCCGAGGGVLEAEPEFSTWAAKDRLGEARATGADALVTACPWCERVFNDTVSETGDTLKVYSVTELLRLSVEGE